ncbi:hypothetical protein [Sorangium cellulosum]|nr:hypothetical protein [Sorangium cellulosum]
MVSLLKVSRSPTRRLLVRRPGLGAQGYMADELNDRRHPGEVGKNLRFA